MEKIRQRLTGVLTAAAVLLGMTACSSTAATETASEQAPEPTQTAAAEERVEYVPVYGDFHTEAQGGYLVNPYSSIGAYADGMEEKSRPEPILLDWSDREFTADELLLELSVTPDFSDAERFSVNGGSYGAYNLLLNTEYYWRIAAAEEELADSEVVSFHTVEQGPRNLYIDGVTNVRDLGGYQTTDGKTVKQGMLIRGGRLNVSSAEEITPEITDAGIETVRALGIKTEMDLRRTEDNEVGSITGSVVEGIDYVCFPMNYQDGLLGNAGTLKEIFTYLADESHYPVYFHCSIGTDRTGMVAFLMNALLGVSEEELYRDYLFSNFADIGSARGAAALRNVTVKVVEEYEGETLAEKTEAFLLDIGVTQDSIDSIRSIMLDD